MNTYTSRLLFQLPKFSLILLNAAAITTCLFIAMHHLIKTEEMAPLPEGITVTDNFRMPKPVIDEYTDIKLPEPPTISEMVPELPADNEVTDSTEWTDKTLFAIAGGNEQINAAVSFVLPQPVYRTQPKYPTSALRRGIEGFVELVFDLNEAGIPLNIVVHQAEPERIFDSAAIKAVSQWRYDPLNSNGEPEIKKNIVARLTFKISGNKK